MKQVSFWVFSSICQRSFEAWSFQVLNARLRPLVSVISSTYWGLRCTEFRARWTVFLFFVVAVFVCVCVCVRVRVRVVFRLAFSLC